jgi:hypothetical protein
MATIKKPIKKAQVGVKVDKTSVAKPKVRGTIKNEPTYNRMLSSNTTKKDSIDYKKGYDFGKKQPKNNLQDLVESPTWSAGNAEGATDKRPTKKISMKTGGTVKAKDGKWMQKVSASIKRRGTEGKCTPITKPGCTGKAKALAKTFKKIAKSNKKK